jgi:hypothetical protein
MRNFYRAILCIIAISMLSGCATLFAPTKWPLKIDTKPEGAWVRVIDRSGEIKFQGTTPVTVFLPAGRFYFKRESYTVRLNMAGVEEKNIHVGCVTNTYYWLNFLWGGIIGFLLIDPATGAMYQLDRESIDIRYDLTTGKARELDDENFEPGDAVRVPDGFTTIPGKVVEVRKQSVVVEYQQNGKIKQTEIQNYMVIRQTPGQAK